MTFGISNIPKDINPLKIMRLLAQEACYVIIDSNTNKRNRDSSSILLFQRLLRHKDHQYIRLYLENRMGTVNSRNNNHGLHPRVGQQGMIARNSKDKAG